MQQVEISLNEYMIGELKFSDPFVDNFMKK